MFEKKTTEHSEENKYKSIPGNTNPKSNYRDGRNGEQEKIWNSKDYSDSSNIINISKFRNPNKDIFTEQSNRGFDNEKPEDRKQKDRIGIGDKGFAGEKPGSSIEFTESGTYKPGNGRYNEKYKDLNRGKQQSETPASELPEEGKYGTKVTVDNKKEINYDELIKMDYYSLFLTIKGLYSKMDIHDFCSLIVELYKKFPENDKRKRMIEDLSKKLGIEELFLIFQNLKKKFNDE